MFRLEFGDPSRPAFHRYEQPWLQWGGPNPDNVYERCAIDPQGVYELRGDVRDVRQAIFSLVDGDMQRLTQVYVNLIANASKFAPESSTIRVGAAAEGDHVTTWVEDEGPGMPEGAGSSIFEQFRRGPDVEPEPGGLGLGLWIVKSIVDRHGGQIVAVRTAEGRTRFNVTLPMEKTE